MLSTFGNKTLQEIAESWRGIDPYTHTSAFADIQELGNCLVANGWCDPVLDADSVVVEYSELMKLFRDLKGLGANNHTTNRLRGLMGKKRWQQFIKNYTTLFGTEDHFPATYQVLYVNAFAIEGKPAQKNKQNEFEISIDEIGGLR